MFVTLLVVISSKEFCYRGVSSNTCPDKTLEVQSFNEIRSWPLTKRESCKLYIVSEPDDVLIADNNISTDSIEFFGLNNNSLRFVFVPSKTIRSLSFKNIIVIYENNENLTSKNLFLEKSTFNVSNSTYMIVEETMSSDTYSINGFKVFKSKLISLDLSNPSSTGSRTQSEGINMIFNHDTKIDDLDETILFSFGENQSTKVIIEKIVPNNFLFIAQVYSSLRIDSTNNINPQTAYKLQVFNQGTVKLIGHYPQNIFIEMIGGVLNMMNSSVPLLNLNVKNGTFLYPKLLKVDFIHYHIGSTSKFLCEEGTNISINTLMISGEVRFESNSGLIFWAHGIVYEKAELTQTKNIWFIGYILTPIGQSNNCGQLFIPKGNKCIFSSNIDFVGVTHCIFDLIRNEGRFTVFFQHTSIVNESSTLWDSMVMKPIPILSGKGLNYSEVDYQIVDSSPWDLNIKTVFTKTRVLYDIQNVNDTMVFLLKENPYFTYLRVIYHDKAFRNLLNDDTISQRDMVWWKHVTPNTKQVCLYFLNNMMSGNILQVPLFQQKIDLFIVPTSYSEQQKLPVIYFDPINLSESVSKIQIDAVRLNFPEEMNYNISVKEFRITSKECIIQGKYNLHSTERVVINPIVFPIIPIEGIKRLYIDPLSEDPIIEITNTGLTFSKLCISIKTNISDIIILHNNNVISFIYTELIKLDRSISVLNQKTLFTSIRISNSQNGKLSPLNIYSEYPDTIIMINTDSDNYPIIFKGSCTVALASYSFPKYLFPSQNQFMGNFLSVISDYGYMKKFIIPYFGVDSSYESKTLKFFNSMYIENMKINGSFNSKIGISNLRNVSIMNHGNVSFQQVRFIENSLLNISLHSNNNGNIFLKNIQGYENIRIHIQASLHINDIPIDGLSVIYDSDMNSNLYKVPITIENLNPSSQYDYYTEFSNGTILLKTRDVPKPTEDSKRSLKAPIIIGASVLVIFGSLFLYCSVKKSKDYIQVLTEPLNH